MQGTGRGKPFRVNEVATKLEVCVSVVSNWCAEKRLRLNTNKTEVMWFGSATNLGELSSADQHLQVRPDCVSPSTVVRDLGDFFDSELTMKSHIIRITSACFCQLRRLRAVRSQLGQDVTSSLVSSRSWTTVMTCWPAFQHKHLHRCSGLCTPLPQASTTLNHTTTSPRHSKPCIGFQ